MMGKEVRVPDEVLAEIAEKLRPLREAARGSSQNPSFKRQVVDAFEQAALNMTVRHNLRNRGKSL